jgi:hypothetical protein
MQREPYDEPDASYENFSQPVACGRMAALRKRHTPLCGDLLGLGRRLAGILAIAQDLSLDAKKVGFDRGRPTDAPQQGRKPQNQFALDCGARVVIRDDGSPANRP